MSHPSVLQGLLTAEQSISKNYQEFHTVRNLQGRDKKKPEVAPVPTRLFNARGREESKDQHQGHLSSSGTNILIKH